MSDVIASDQLRLLIERIERLEEEKKGIADDIKDVYGEAKSTGFDVKTIRAIVRLRKMDVNTRREAEALLDTYKAALGMLDGTPLGRWAVERLQQDEERGAGAPSVEIGFPGEEERFAITKRYLSPYAVDEDTIAGIADAMDVASPALLREACEGAKRSLVLGGRMGLDNSLDAIMLRFASSAAPAADMPTPKLWQEPRAVLAHLAKLPWPPVRDA